jgi:hypothetical protein
VLEEAVLEEVEEEGATDANIPQQDVELTIDNDPELTEAGLIRETALAVNGGTTTSAPIPTTMAIPWSDPRRPPRILLANYDKDTDSFSECLNPRECVHKNRNGIKIPIKWLPIIKVKEIIIINNSGSKFVTKKIENITENIHGTFIKGYEGSNTIELRAYYTDGGGYYLMSNPLIVNVE